MHSALRPYVTTGIALVGTGAIALAPLAPPAQVQGTPTMSKQVSQQVTLSAKVITINPSPDAVDMSEQLGGSYCPDANTCVELEYMPIWSLPGQYTLGVDALRDALSGYPGEDITIFGFSEGATVASQWLAAHLEDPVAYPAPENLTFVVIGNPTRKYGGSGVPWGQVWPESDFNVIDVMNQYDPTGDLPANPFNILATLNATMGFFTNHLGNGYTDVDINDPDNSRWEEDGIEYVFAPSPNLPLLEPLRAFGMDELADELDAPLRYIIEQGYNRDPRITLPDYDPGPSPFNIPINLVEMFANVPANMVAGTNRFAEAMRDSGSWWVYTPVNVLGWDPANPEMTRAFVDFLLPIPSLSTPIGIAADYWARANLPMNEGCTGTGRNQCLNPNDLTDQMFKVMIWDLYNPDGYTFDGPITPPVNPVSENEGYWGQELGEDGEPVEWYGETVYLEPFAELTSFWEYLNAPPEGIETPTLSDHLSAAQNLFEALMVTWYPFVPKSQIWNPNETFFAYLVRPFAKILCPDCNEVDPFMPTDWEVGDDIPPGAYIPPSVSDDYDPETGEYIGPPIEDASEDAEDAPESQSMLASLFSTEEAEATEEEVTDEAEAEEATDVVSTAVQNLREKFEQAPAAEEETPASEDVTEEVSDEVPAEEDVDDTASEAPVDTDVDAEEQSDGKTDSGADSDPKPEASDDASEDKDAADDAKDDAKDSGEEAGGKHRKGDDSDSKKSESKSESKSDSKSDSGSGSDKKSSASSNSGGGSDD